MKIKLIKAASAGLILSASCFVNVANAGAIFLTGHDVLSHGNQNGYDTIILDYLRGEGLSNEIAANQYNIGLTGSGSLSGFGTVTTSSGVFATGADFSSFLAGIDVLVVGEYSGGFLNTYTTLFTDWFNAGGDIWVDSSNGTAGYYDWLPAGVAADGPGISESTGFVATTEGAALGITSANVNNSPTHNRFSSWAPAFTVFEEHGNYAGSAISIGIQDATLTEGGIENNIPEPSTLAMFALGIMGLGFRRIKTKN